MQRVIYQYAHSYLRNILWGTDGQTLFLPAVLEVLVECGTGLCHPRTDGIDAQALPRGRGDVWPQRAHKALHAVLGSLVDGKAGSFFETGRAGEQQDRTVVVNAIMAQVHAGNAGHIQISDEIDVEVHSRWNLGSVSQKDISKERQERAILHVEQP